MRCGSQVHTHLVCRGLRRIHGGPCTCIWGLVYGGFRPGAIISWRLTAMVSYWHLSAMSRTPLFRRCLVPLCHNYLVFRALMCVNLIAGAYLIAGALFDCRGLCYAEALMAYVGWQSQRFRGPGIGGLTSLRFPAVSSLPFSHIASVPPANGSCPPSFPSLLPLSTPLATSHQFRRPKWFPPSPFPFPAASFHPSSYIASVPLENGSPPPFSPSLRGEREEY